LWRRMTLLLLFLRGTMSFWVFFRSKWRRFFDACTVRFNGSMTWSTVLIMALLVKVHRWSSELRWCQWPITLSKLSSSSS
jgi:hypothetical protein